MSIGRRILRALGGRTDSQPKPGVVFRDADAPWCPELVVVPAGEFMMGSTEAEYRWAWQQGAEDEIDDEEPRHRVTIGAPFAVGKYAVTRGQFAAFVEATDHDMSGGCWTYGSGTWHPDPSVDWRSPGYEQTDWHPVVGVSWEDAKAYVEWLGRETRQPFRLLSEAEWEYACRAGTITRYWWGDDLPTYQQANCGSELHRTTEVGVYPPNPWGLYEMHGNVSEWCEDCWHGSYSGAPEDGSAWTSGDCSLRSVRGGSWFDSPVFLRSAFREWNEAGDRFIDLGLRVARALR